jgi:uncharacterized protein YdeI (YjbR/CyaY-like superfamily)
MEVSRDRLKFFRNPAALRKWLDANHSRVDELWIGFYKKASGKKGITYHEALDEALCFGWIDGIRKSVDADSFAQRFTPRRHRSVWSNVNIAKVKKLIDEGRMTEAGLAEFEKRSADRTAIYSFERDSVAFPPALAKQFKAERKAWDFFQSQSPYYRRLATWWVVSARRDDTRQRRLLQLIDDSSAQRRVVALSPSARKKA